MSGFGRAISDTCDGGKEKCEGGVMPNTFEAKLRPFTNVIKNKLFSDHFFFHLSGCCFCLFLSIHCLFNGLVSHLQKTYYHF